MPRSQVDAAQIADGSITASKLGLAAAGSSGQIQLNSSGSFGASANLTWDEVDLLLAVGVPAAISSGPRIEVSSDDGLSNARLSAVTYTNTPTTSSLVNCFRARGTSIAPLAVQSGDVLGQFSVVCYDGTAFQNSTFSGLVFQAAETWTPTARGTQLFLTVIRPGTIATRDALVCTVDPGSGNALVGVNTTTLPAYTLDVLGDVNVTGSFKVLGVTVIAPGGGVGSLLAYPDSFNVASGDRSTVGGGDHNIAGPATGAVVSGGESNTASGLRAAIGGGYQNTASGSTTTVAGGTVNIAGGIYATIGGGFTNSAGTEGATIAGGKNNDAGGLCSSIPGGENNSSLGRWAFASGRRAKADVDGSFVFADSTNSDFIATVADSFVVRVSGGFGIGTASPAYKLDVVGDVNTSTLYRVGGVQISSSNLSNSANIILTTSALGGDLSGFLPNATVATVGTSSAVNIHTSELLANAATDANTFSAIVKRDGAGSFSASTASLFAVSASGNVDAATYSVATVPGVSGTFTTVDSKTVTVTNGLITSIV